MKYTSARKNLTARLEELLLQIGKIEAHLTNPLEKDSQERSQQLENDEVLGALDEAGRKELRQIRDALQRLDDGTYGTCDQCGESISKARLDALATAERCIQCAEAAS
jgi:RNA polymerase-binding transcription factor DksA